MKVIRVMNQKKNRIKLKNNKKTLKNIFIALFICLAFSNIYAYGGKDYQLSSQDLKLKVFKQTGNFCLYAMPAKEDRKPMPLYNDRSKARCNKFFVYYNGKAYELKTPTKIEQDDYSITKTYEVKKKFVVTQKLSFVQKNYGMTAPPLKIETKVEILEGELVDIAMKALFDTNLGEERKPTLYTDLRSGIYSETVLNPRLEKDSAIISANPEYACIFLLKHSTASPMDNIFVANWQRLRSHSWYPKYIKGRSFSTEYFRNDSALLFMWPMKKLTKGENYKIDMMIGYYDYYKEKLMEKFKCTCPKHGKNAQCPNAPVVKETVEEKLVEEKVQEETVQEVKVPVVEKKEDDPSQYVTKQERKDYEYIKALLEKIAKVEEDIENLTEEEIESLTKQADNAINDIKDDAE